jgi:hypothetical protein
VCQSAQRSVRAPTSRNLHATAPSVAVNYRIPLVRKMIRESMSIGLKHPHVAKSLQFAPRLFAAGIIGQSMSGLEFFQPALQKNAKQTIDCNEA